MNAESLSPVLTGIVSVLVPLYRHESTVERTLNSVLGSDCARIELIVCDDASPDRSHELATAWIAREGHRFRRAECMRHAHNLGIAGNLNHLLHAAHGEYVTLLASDDELAPRAIDLQREYLERHPEHDFVFANVELIDGASAILASRVVGRRRARLLQSPLVRMVDLVCNWGMPWPRLFARREPFVLFGPYLDQLTIEDRWSALRIAQTRRFGYLDEVVHRYRVRTGGGTGGIAQQRVLDDMVATERQLIPQTTGLLRALLILRDRSFRMPGRSRADRPFWWFLRRVLDAMHRALVGA
jgi:glycosyltransferase involved in cell wall biosynthesis